MSDHVLITRGAGLIGSHGAFAARRRDDGATRARAEFEERGLTR